jgi:hypothetical protein
MGKRRYLFCGKRKFTPEKSLKTAGAVEYGRYYNH